MTGQNKKIWSIAFLFLFTHTFSQSQKEYKLISKTQNSDIRYKLFKKYETSISKEEITKSFTPKRGKYDVYVFISADLGNSYDGTQKIFHDFLILKADPQTRVIKDAFQYTFEWTDSPSIDLYRLSESTITLKDSLKLDLLKMKIKAPYTWNGDKDEYLLDGGTLRMK